MNNNMNNNKRNFSDFSDNDNNNDNKRKKFNNIDNILNEKVNVLNKTYLLLLENFKNNELYSKYENVYRNEEFDIVTLLKNHKLVEDYLSKFPLNHIFKVLPLDKISEDQLCNDENIDEDDNSDVENIDEESEDEEFNILEEAKVIFERFFQKNDAVEESLEDTIKKSNLNCMEKKKLYDELNKINKINKNNIPDKIKILQLDLPLQVKAELLDKINLLDNSPNDDSKIREWIKEVLKVPWGKYCENPINSNDKDKINNFLINFHNKLNDTIYGQNNLKESLIEIITKWITNGSKKGNCIAIHGAPGVGKTSIVRGLASALNRPFCSFSLAGVSDENYLTGFPITYEGSACGRFAKMLMKSKCMNPIIFMDELDKVDTKKSMNIFNKLIEITDFSQNHEIEDHYLGSNIKLDLSKCIFVFSLNNINLIDPILKDRLEIINVNGFEKDDKIQIMKKFLLPNLLKDYSNLKYNFSDDILKYIISKVKNEKGVRNLQQTLAKILRKLNVLEYYNNSLLSYKTKKNTKKITSSLIDLLLKNDNKIDPMILKMYL